MDSSTQSQRRLNRSRVGVATLALMMFTAACGSDEATIATTEVTAADDGAMDDGAMDGGAMDGGAMNMGDASATRADEVEDAVLATGQFVLLDTRPQGFDNTSGTAWIARHSAGTTVTLELDGLIPETEYISHVHADACASNGGEHYQFDVGGSTMPPNEIHLALTSDADGHGFMTAENALVAGPEAVAFVVHPVDLIDNKIACADFVTQDDAS